MAAPRRRIASLADIHQKENPTLSLEPLSNLREESFEQPDCPLVLKPKPLRDFRSLPPGQMETRDLISLYWQDVAAAQSLKVSCRCSYVCLTYTRVSWQEPERGSLTVQLGYNAAKGHICVKVLEGQNLPALDDLSGE